MKRLGIASFTARGGLTANFVAALLEKEYDIVRYESGKDAGSVPGGGCLKNWCGNLFSSGADGIIFVGACGIAVRTIAPFLKSKTTDPAVLVVDEAGQFVISLLSGHIGGANRLALQVAEILGATPVITTATDVNGKFAVDVFAKDNKLRIDDMRAAREISAAILRGEKIGVLCEGEIEGEIPPELVLIEQSHSQQNCSSGDGENAVSFSDPEAPPVQLGALIEIGVSLRDITFSTDSSVLHSAEQPALWVSQVPPVILSLYPKSYILGIGCRKGKSAAEISLAVNQVLFDLGISMKEIAGVASIDLKKEEAGLLEFCGKNKLRFETYSAERLAAMEGNFSQSPFVRSVTGVDNVCERAALCMAEVMSWEADPEMESHAMQNSLAAMARPASGIKSNAGQENGKGGRLVLGKQADNGVTVALAERKWKVHF